MSVQVCKRRKSIPYNHLKKFHIIRSPLIPEIPFQWRSKLILRNTPIARRNMSKKNPKITRNLHTLFKRLNIPIHPNRSLWRKKSPSRTSLKKKRVRRSIRVLSLSRRQRSLRSSPKFLKRRAIPNGEMVAHLNIVKNSPITLKSPRTKRESPTTLSLTQKVTK